MPAPEIETADGEPSAVTAAGWRVFKSHDGHRCLAAAIAEGRAVAIYAYRDVRDVVFSLMHKRRLTFEELLRQGMIHQVLANDRFWTRQPNVLVQRYDDILADPVGAVRELALHVGIKPAAGEAERLADEYSLAANKARTEALRRRLEQGGVNLDEASNSLICDSSTLLHWNHVRDGGSGSWFVESTPRQRVILRRMCGRWLTSRGYPPAPEGASRDAIAPPRWRSARGSGSSSRSFEAGCHSGRAPPLSGSRAWRRRPGASSGSRARRRWEPPSGPNRRPVRTNPRRSREARRKDAGPQHGPCETNRGGGRSIIGPRRSACGSRRCAGTPA